MRIDRSGYRIQLCLSCLWLDWFSLPNLPSVPLFAARFRLGSAKLVHRLLIRILVITLFLAFRLFRWRSQPFGRGFEVAVQGRYPKGTGHAHTLDTPGSGNHLGEIIAGYTKTFRQDMLLGCLHPAPSTHRFGTLLSCHPY
jgi:hypothetical protein